MLELNLSRTRRRWYRATPKGKRALAAVSYHVRELVGELDEVPARTRMLMPERVVASQMSALAALVFVAAHYALEAVRMAGDFSGLWDTSLQGMVWAPVGRCGPDDAARRIGVHDCRSSA